MKESERGTEQMVVGNVVFSENKENPVLVDIACVNEPKPEMDYTSEKPTVSGYYWIKFAKHLDRKGRMERYRLVEYALGHIYGVILGHKHKLYEDKWLFDGAEWYGPITPPEVKE